jgi:hypothetical protein
VGRLGIKEQGADINDSDPRGREASSEGSRLPPTSRARRPTVFVGSCRSLARFGCQRCAKRDVTGHIIMADGGIVSLTCDERDEAGGRMRDHAAATASRHWFAASARKIRSVERETRWR